MKRIIFITLLSAISILMIGQNAFKYPIIIGTNGGANGQITLNGSTSGSVVIKSNVVAGAGTVFQLPANNGTNGYLLSTDGAGVLSWIVPPVTMTYPGAGIPISTGAGWAGSLTNNSTNWDNAYTDRLKWDGGSIGLTAATGRTSLGGTTVGQAFFTLTNPSAITFPQINADNSVTAKPAADFKTALSLSASDVGLGNVTNKLHIEAEDSVNYTLGYMSRYDGVTGFDARKYFWHDYYIEEVSGVTYARPSPNTSYTAYSDAVPSVPINAAIAALTNGGSIYIAAGLYDNCDSILIIHDNITIKGAGMHKTILKLKSNFDATKTYNGGFMQIYAGALVADTLHNIYLSDFKIDGNFNNQTKYSDGNITAPNGLINGIATVGKSGSRFFNVNCEDIYLTGFTYFGFRYSQVHGGSILNCKVDSVGWNGIMLGGGGSGYNYSNTNHIRVVGNTVQRCGDVGIDLQGVFLDVHDNIVTEIRNFPYGSGNTYNAISMENYYDYNVITNNNLQHNYIGIAANAHTRGSMTRSKISGNKIDSCYYGIFLGGDSAMITDNYITNSELYGIAISGGKYNYINGNYISSYYGGSYPIFLIYTGGVGANYNVITNNNIRGDNNPQNIIIQANCNNNIIANNILQGKLADEYSIYDLGTDNVKFGNLNANNFSFDPETGKHNYRLTATSDGLTTGLIKPGSQFITVSSSTSANYICTLPLASANTVGTLIRGRVGVNGFELRVAASQAGTVYLNGVTTDVEAAIPADSNFEVTQVDATHWILKAWDAVGAAIAAIVPDGI